MRVLNKVLVSAALLGAPAATAPAQANDEAGVRAAINQYFRGHATALRDSMAAPFLPTAHIEGIRDGVFTSELVRRFVFETPRPE
jgi:hypothetical protein